MYSLKGHKKVIKKSQISIMFIYKNLVKILLFKIVSSPFSVKAFVSFYLSSLNEINEEIKKPTKFNSGINNFYVTIFISYKKFR
jgi:hypothetical protein